MSQLLLPEDKGPQFEITEGLNMVARDLRALASMIEYEKERVATLPPPELKPDMLLSTREVAAFFGVRPHTVTTWREHRRLPEPWAIKSGIPIWLGSQIDAVQVRRGLPVWPETPSTTDE